MLIEDELPRGGAIYWTFLFMKVIFRDCWSWFGFHRVYEDHFLWLGLLVWASSRL